MIPDVLDGCMCLQEDRQHVVEGSRRPWKREGPVLDVPSCVSLTALWNWREVLLAHSALFWEGMVFKFFCLPAMDFNSVVSTHSKVFAVSARLMLT